LQSLSGLWQALGIGLAPLLVQRLTTAPRLPPDTDTDTDSMERTSYYEDQKYCAGCGQYVQYLMSVEASYCIHCGERVHLFSREDWESFNQSLQERRPKGGRPRKQRGKESA
jgi:hypothetical protein